MLHVHIFGLISTNTHVLGLWRIIMWTFLWSTIAFAKIKPSSEHSLHIRVLSGAVDQDPILCQKLRTHLMNRATNLGFMTFDSVDCQPSSSAFWRLTVSRRRAEIRFEMSSGVSGHHFAIKPIRFPYHPNWTQALDRLEFMSLIQRYFADQRPYQWMITQEDLQNEGQLKASYLHEEVEIPATLVLMQLMFDKKDKLWRPRYLTTAQRLSADVWQIQDPIKDSDLPLYVMNIKGLGTQTRSLEAAALDWYRSEVIERSSNTWAGIHTLSVHWDHPVSQDFLLRKMQSYRASYALAITEYFSSEIGVSVTPYQSAVNDGGLSASMGWRSYHLDSVMRILRAANLQVVARLGAFDYEARLPTALGSAPVAMHDFSTGVMLGYGLGGRYTFAHFDFVASIGSMYSLYGKSAYLSKDTGGKHLHVELDIGYQLSRMLLPKMVVHIQDITTSYDRIQDADATIHNNVPVQYVFSQIGLGLDIRF